LIKCKKCDDYVEPNHDYCKTHQTELEEQAVNTFGREEFERCIKTGKFPIVESACSVGYAKSHCERCHRKFRYWRPKIIGFNKVNQKWIEICGDCIKITDTV
jgi:hypothetical protein